MQPDVLVFRSASLQLKWQQIQDHWLAVEVWSPSSVVYDREIKRNAYLQAGVREVWLVDCHRKQVLVSKAGEPPDIAQDLPEIFRGLD